MAVSYTHLNTVFRLFERDIHELALEALILDDIHTLEAVSYTHLDVYKRQGLSL